MSPYSTPYWLWPGAPAIAVLAPGYCLHYFKGTVSLSIYIPSTRFSGKTAPLPTVENRTGSETTRQRLSNAGRVSHPTDPALRITHLSRTPTQAQVTHEAPAYTLNEGPASAFPLKPDRNRPYRIIGVIQKTHASPVDISTRFVQVNGSLGPLIFTNYSDKSALLALGNTGHTVEVSIRNGVTLSGGGLTSTYQAVAFHFHWGSEHRLNQKQFPMEMHVVHTKTGLSLAEAKNDSTGLAVLGVFIDVLESANSSHLSRLSDLLNQISVPGTRISLNSSFSLDDILGDVNREEYYRYLGSLTTPTCEEAVVWTVFKNPLLVPARVIKAFTSNVHHNTSEGLELLTNNFRPPQPLGSRQVLVSAVSAPKLDASTTPAANVTSSSRTTAKGHIHARSDLCLLIATALLSLLHRSV